MAIKALNCINVQNKSSELPNFLTCNPPRSAIHGRGLFCKRNIEAGEMVIEYAGTVIRAVLTDKREKYYDGKVSCAWKLSEFLLHLFKFDCQSKNAEH